jgi:hypothetical protein
MSSRFARILEKELEAAGRPLCSLSPSSGGEDRPAASARLEGGGTVFLKPKPADSSNFSARALSMSSSLRHYARDAGRSTRSEESCITGWNEAGYLRDDGKGLSGEMRFATASGTSVCIRAGAEREKKADVRILAVRDGVEHVFSLEDFAGCRRREAQSGAAPYVALPCGRSG